MRAIYFAMSDGCVFIEQITQQPCFTFFKKKKKKQPCFTSLQCIVTPGDNTSCEFNKLRKRKLYKRNDISYECLNQIYSFVLFALFSKKLLKQGLFAGTEDLVSSCCHTSAVSPPLFWMCGPCVGLGYWRSLVQQGQWLSLQFISLNLLSFAV